MTRVDPKKINMWYMKLGKSIDHLTTDDWRQVEAAGRSPPECQDDYLDVMESARKSEYDRCIKDIWDRLLA